jgi:regulatory protein
MALALRYLAGRDRTEAQVLAYLERRGVDAPTARGIIRRLRQQRYLDDDAYARRWAAERLQRRPMGRERLQAELLARGIPAAMAARATEHAFGDVSEEALARKVLAVGTRNASRLRRYGFSEETIDAVLPQP